MRRVLLILVLASCARVPEAPAPPVAEVVDARPLAVLAPARALHQRLQTGERPVVLDVRPAAAFAAGHIAGAIHVEPWALKAHPAAAEAVIVGTGAEPPAERWLSGGMAAWCRAGLPVVGSCLGADWLTGQQVLTQPGLRVAPSATVPEDLAGTVVVSVCDPGHEPTWRAALATVEAHVLFVSAQDLAEVRARQAALADRREITTRGGVAQATEPVRSEKGCGCP